MGFVAATFVLALIIVLGAYWMFVARLEEKEQLEVRKRIRFRGDSSPLRGLGVLKQADRLSAIGLLDGVLTSMGTLTDKLQRLIGLSGLKVTVAVVLLASVMGALAAFVVVQVGGLSAWMSLVAAVVAALLPYGALRFMVGRRMRAFEEQFPEAIEIVSRTLRAGHAFTTGLKLASEELPPPVAAEFKALYDQQTFGMPIDDALRAFASRVPVLDARFFVTAVLTQREAGGNLAEVLDNLATVIRERFRVRRQVRAISAHGRITGVVLAAMPVVLAILMLAQSRTHFSEMLAHPVGQQMAIGAVLLQIVGAFAIRRITNIRY